MSALKWEGLILAQNGALAYFQWRQTGLMITSANRAGRGILWNKMDQHKGPITILSGRGKKTTIAMALMDWSLWRHCIFFSLG